MYSKLRIWIKEHSDFLLSNQNGRKVPHFSGQGFQWDSTEERCVGRVGSSCGSPEDCIGNSTCVDLYCECESGFSRDIHGNCRQVHGEKCDNNSDCNEDVHLFCSDGNCRCVNDTTRVFESGYCGSLFGEPCDPLQDFFGFPTGQTGNKCQGTLKCQKKESGFNCGCPSGTQLLEDRTCGIPAGSPRWEITSLCLLSCVFYHFIF
ncbi:unnamed protein product [Allacma fusca]|uniref:Uncharacterized protein n=1 Tax=Allacma fusca TaxID=39272 RepID=A0A8J2KIX5_9HEXA|nr:unnamed protein product [Allacma fusca]